MSDPFDIWVLESQWRDGGSASVVVDAAGRVVARVESGHENAEEAARLISVAQRLREIVRCSRRIDDDDVTNLLRWISSGGGVT